MACYEMIREIFNSCKRNAMRDIFIDEVETDSPEAYVKSMYESKEAEISKSVSAEGAEIYDVLTKGMAERYSFTKLD